MAQDHSFDITSPINFQELDNAIHQTQKEILTRFDFKGSISSIEFNKKEKKIFLVGDNEFKLKTLVDIFQTRCVKRGVSVRSFTFQALQKGVGDSVKQEIVIQEGIPSEKAKEMVREIKNLKLKVQPQIQSDQVRVQGAKIDDLQQVITYLKSRDFGLDLSFQNFR